MANTRPFFYLDNDSDWPRWIQRIEAVAIDLDMWEYVNPKTPTEERPLLPSKPLSPSTLPVGARERGPDDMLEALAGLPPGGLAIYGQLRADYALELKQYNRHRDAVARLREIIAGSVAPRHYALCCHPEETITTWLTCLARYAGLSDEARRTRARSALDKFNRDQENRPLCWCAIEGWLARWGELFVEARLSGLEGTSADSCHYWQSPFLETLYRSPLADWAMMYQIRIVGKQQENSDFHDMLTDARDSIYRLGPALKPNAACCATCTWQGRGGKSRR
ncbi:gag protein [Colletotrichum musicola]|uniref:Gag protein n=1 Tax=Colletotrichum musicola TaxID=2175873 RepID=A0A8H6NKR0_9PEZI|nr:gag protein [Colletotrichum musicola]